MADNVKNPGTPAGATGALVDVHANADKRETITFDGKWREGSRRERDDDYRAVVVQFNAKNRVIRCKDGIQWIVQRRDGESAGRVRWTGSRYFRTRNALIAFCRTLCGPFDPAALARLPEVLG